LNLRSLLLIVVAVVLMFAVVFFVFRGHGSSASATPTVTPTPSTQTIARIQKVQAERAFVRYANLMNPLLARAATWMDRTTLNVAAHRNNPRQLLNVCNTDSGQVEALQAMVTDIPWPPAQTPARSWRRQIFGTFNLYRGAVVECRNVFDTKDLSQTRFAVNDLATAARQIHTEVNVGLKFAQAKVGSA
jgi:hypothetical protein